jgi:excisionase family DNA binding protein
MSDQPAAGSDQWSPTVAATTAVTVEQAAAILGVSVSTVKRRIRAGLLRAERVSRPQGTVWLVERPAAVTGAADQRSAAASVAATTAVTGVDDEARREPRLVAPQPQAEAMATLMQTTIATVLGPLVAELAVCRQTNERQAETIGELRARVATLEAENGHLAASGAAQPPEPITEPLRLWQRSWAVYGAVGLLVVIVPVLAWALVAVYR